MFSHAQISKHFNYKLRKKKNIYIYIYNGSKNDDNVSNWNMLLYFN